MLRWEKVVDYIMKVLVTGADGFIGNNLIILLKENGFLAHGLDNKGNKSDFIEDITDVDWTLYDLGSYDAVIHLAAKVSVPESFLLPDIYDAVNVKATERLFKLCSELNVKKVIFASSAAVYGDSSKEIKIVGEEGNLESPYAENKFEGEDIARRYANSDTKFICLRFFNVYGPGQSSDSEYSSVIPLFINKIKLGEDLTIYGDGLQTRDFIHVKDVCKVIISSIKNPSLPNYVCFNLGTGEGVSILSLANNLLSLANNLDSSLKSKIIMKSKRTGDIMHSIADIKPLGEVYDINSFISLDNGLRKLLISSLNGV
jgi:UDP-glucose 4-epimerase